MARGLPGADSFSLVTPGLIQRGASLVDKSRKEMVRSLPLAVLKRLDCLYERVV